MTTTGTTGHSELRLRVLSSIVLATVAGLSAWLGGWVLALVWLGAAIAVAWEWLSMTRTAPRGPVFGAVAAGIATILIAWITGNSLLFVGAIAASVATAVVAAGTMRDRAWTVAGLAYAAPIALVPVIFRFHDAAGIWSLLWIFAVVWTTDVTAYFVGRAIGGPKLWPAVSPKKTWSGFAGGLVGAVIAGAALASWAASGPLQIGDLAGIATLSAIASVASQGGDLFESAMKRHFGVKDSGHLIPGHGGFMDRLDGFAAVALLICILMPLAKLSLWTVAP